MCKENNSSALILVKLKNPWAPYLIDQVKGTFGIRESSFSSSNHSSVNDFVMEYTEGIHV